MNRPQLTTFDDVLAIMLEEGEVVPSHDDLTAWIKRFPAFAEELTDYFAAAAFQLEEVGDVPDLDVEHFANVAVSEALNLLYTQQAIAGSEAAFRLSQMAKRVGVSGEEVARQVGIDEEMFMKLDQGRIVPLAGVPQLLAERFATALVANIHQVWAAISLPKLASSRLGLLKSRGRAQVATETFEEALGRSSLSESEKAAWQRAVRKGTGPP